MDYRYLGRSALKVSPLCLGTMMFGGATDEPTAKRILDKARGQGINFLDAADLYNGGKCEEVVGRSIKGSRHHWVVATKFGYNSSGKPNEGGQSRKWIFQDVDDSLRRLGTDYIDVLYFHRSDNQAPFEEPLRGDQGPDRARQVALLRRLELQGLAHRRGVPDRRPARHGSPDRLPAALQHRRPACPKSSSSPPAGHFGIGVAPYSPLARGVLSGKYDPARNRPADSRAGRNDTRIMQTEWRPESLEIARKVAERAEAKGLSTVAFAIAWAMRNKFVTAPIVGPRTEEQWDAYLPAIDAVLDADDEAFVDSLVPPGHASTPGYTDPAYPIEGRAVRN